MVILVERTHIASIHRDELKTGIYGVEVWQILLSKSNARISGLFHYNLAGFFLYFYDWRGKNNVSLIFKKVGLASA